MSTRIGWVTSSVYEGKRGEFGCYCGVCVAEPLRIGYFPLMPDRPADSDDASLRRNLEKARHTTASAKKSLLTPKGMRGVAKEAAWLATHVAMYPFGLVEDKYRHAEERHNLDGLPPVQRGLIIGDVEAAGTPIILIHGIIDNHTVFAFLRRALNRRGFGRVITLNYSPLSDDIPRVARRLKSLVEKVRRETGYERVHVIGHSMGGVVARYYVQCLGGFATCRHDARLPGAAFGGQADAPGQPDRAGTGCPGAWVPNPDGRDLVGSGSDDHPQTQRPDRPPGPQRAQCLLPRGGPHVLPRRWPSGA
jgi:Lipase (class 2)